jgi:GxxExxY protein
MYQADTEEYIYSEKTKRIIGACFEVHHHLGHGFLEAVYHEALWYEFEDRNIPFESERSLDVWYKKRKLAKQYTADFICFNEIILEIKTVEALNDDHTGQVLNYLKATGMKLGLLINFGTRKMQIKRVIL